MMTKSGKKTVKRVRKQYKERGSKKLEEKVALPCIIWTWTLL